MDDDKNLPEIPKKIMNTFNWALAGFFVVLLLYFYQFNGGFGDQEKFGQFGDFIGGTLNPFLSFLTIVLLIWSIRLQMSELALTREEMKKSTAALEESAAHQEHMLKLQTNNTLHKELSEHLGREIKKFDTLMNKSFFKSQSMTSKNGVSLSLIQMKRMALSVNNPDPHTQPLEAKVINFFNSLKNKAKLPEYAVHIQLINESIENIIDAGNEMAECTYSESVKTSTFLKVMHRVEYARLHHVIGDDNATAYIDKLKIAYNRQF